MELFPESQYLRFYSLKLNGVHTTHIPIKELIPITKYDYWGASWKAWYKQNPILDLDMVYASQVTKEMFVFDKSGEWNDEGVYHKALDMETTFKETDWYDEFNVNQF